MRFHTIYATFLALGIVFLTPPAAGQAAGDGHEWRTVEMRRQSPSPYPNGADGARTEISVEGARYLKVHLDYVDFEQGFDFLVVRDSRGAQVNRLTGFHQDFELPVVEGSVVFLDIYSDYSTSGRGFLVDRVSAYLPVTPALPTADGPRWVEQLVDVASPSPYPRNLQREPYQVFSPGAKNLRLFFEFIDVEQGFDFVEVIDVSGLPVARYTGLQSGFWTESITGDKAIVALSSDFSNSGRGFRVSRISAYLPAGVTPGLPPGPAHGGLASVVYLLGGAPGAEPMPFPQGLIQLRPRGENPDRFRLIFSGTDAEGRPYPAELMDVHVQVHGEIGDMREVAPGEFLFTAGTVSGRFGEVHVDVPGLAGELPDIQIAITLHSSDEGEDGDDHGDQGQHRRRRLASLGFTLEDAVGQSIRDPGGVTELFINAPGRDRAIVRVVGLDRRGRDMPMARPPSYRVFAPARSLSTVQRSDGSFMISAGSIPCDEARVEFYALDGLGREVKSVLQFRVSPRPQLLASFGIDASASGFDPHGGPLAMVIGGEPFEFVLQPLDDRGRTFVPSGLTVRPLVRGDQVVSIEHVGEYRYRIKSRGRPGRAQVIFQDQRGTVSSAPIDVAVRQPVFHHLEAHCLLGENWTPLADGRLDLEPLGMGTDRIDLEVRPIDELGHVMPAARFPVQVSLVQKRVVAACDSIGNNRFRLRATAREALDGMQLLVTTRGNRRPLLSIPMAIVKPVPRAERLRILSSGVPHVAELDGATVSVPLTGNQERDYFDFEVRCVDQFGKDLIGVEFEPVFSMPAGPQPVQLRRISATPSVWRLLPLGQECNPIRLEVGMRGQTFATHLMVGVVDPTFVTLGTRVAESWIRWGNRRDYDFEVPAGLAGSRIARLMVSKRFKVERIFVKLASGEWRPLAIEEVSLKAGARKEFDLRSLPGDEVVRVLRIGGLTEPGAEVIGQLKRKRDGGGRPGGGRRR